MSQPGSDERLRRALEALPRYGPFHGENNYVHLQDVLKVLREAALADSPGVVTDARSAETGELGLPITSPLGQSASILESAAPAPSSVGQTRVEESAMASASDDYDWTAACLHLLMCGKDPSCKRCREIEAHIKATGGDSHD
jgi:hypothetical protein